MRRKSKYVVLSLVLCLSMMLFLCGCGEEKSGSTIEEPEITGKYLQEDYSQQLLNDGAETVVGYVTLDKLGEGDCSVHALTLQYALQVVEYFRTHSQSFSECWSTYRHDHEFLDIHSVVRMGTAV